MITITKKGANDETLVELKEIVKGSWINLTNPSKEEVEYVANKIHISKDLILAALDENEKPRFEKEKDVLIIFRVPNVSGPLGKEIETIPIGIIITHPINYIVTVSLKETEVMKDFYNLTVGNFYTTMRTRFLIQILSRINTYFMKYLEKIEDEIDRAEASLMQSMRNKDIMTLFEYQKTMIYFNRAIMANGLVLDSILKGKVVMLFQDDEDLLDDIIIENQQSLEMTATYYNVLSNTITAYSSLVSNNLNSVMKLLTSITIILSIPTIISSIYGMNVFLPLQNSPLAFTYTLLVSLILTVVVAIIFIKKRFL